MCDEVRKKRIVVASLNTVEGTTDKVLVVNMLNDINVRVEEEGLVSVVRMGRGVSRERLLFVEFVEDLDKEKRERNRLWKEIIRSDLNESLGRIVSS